MARVPELNFIIVSGRLTRDPDIRMTQKGSTVCSFSIANNRSYMDPSTNEWKDEVAYISATAFGALADRLKERIKKGTPVIVEGRLVMNEFTGKDGQQRRELLINASRVQVVPTGAAQEANASAEEATEEVAEDDVPF